MKTMLITGAASGIGKVTADMAAERDYSVVCCDIAYERIMPAEEYWGGELRRRYLIGNVSSWPELPYADVVVACAGVKANPTPFEEMTAAEWVRVISVNLDGMAATCQQAGKNMIEHGTGGSIVIVGSMSGIVANKGFHNAHYNASKAATHQLARSLAVEWARYGIRVNVVAPGPIVTPMSDGLRLGNPGLYAEFGSRVPLGRWGKAEEVAEAILFLASDAASFITGATLVVDGGYSVW